MAKYSIYAVGYGVDPQTKQPVYGLKVPTWKECEQYIKGVEGAKFKGFLTDTEADAWIDKIKHDLGVSGTVVTGTAVKSAKRKGKAVAESAQKPAGAWDDSNDITDDSEARSKFIDICNQAGINPHAMLDKLMKDFVNTYAFMCTDPQEEDEDDDKLPFN